MLRVMTTSKVTQANDYGPISILARSRRVSMSLSYVVPSHNFDTRYPMYSHQGYQEGHLIQEQVYGPPRSDYYQHYQP
jgi:hypothetical protein